MKKFFTEFKTFKFADLRRNDKRLLLRRQPLFELFYPYTIYERESEVC